MLGARTTLAQEVTASDVGTVPDPGTIPAPGTVPQGPTLNDGKDYFVVMVHACYVEAVGNRCDDPGSVPAADSFLNMWAGMPGSEDVFERDPNVPELLWPADANGDFEARGRWPLDSNMRITIYGSNGQQGSVGLPWPTWQGFMIEFRIAKALPEVPKPRYTQYLPYARSPYE